MRFKRTIKWILEQSPPYNLMYPEHKPISEKLKEMVGHPESDWTHFDTPEEVLYYLIPKQLPHWKSWVSNKTDLTKKQILYQLLDFDLIESYFWFKTAKGLSNPKVMDGLMNSFKTLADGAEKAGMSMGDYCDKVAKEAEKK